jgi:hypothetical protein
MAVSTKADLRQHWLGAATQLNANAAAAATTLTVLDSTGFAANDYVIIEERGIEKAELRKVSSVTATTIIVTSGVTLAHTKWAKVQKIDYNQVKLLASATSGGTYAAQDTQAINVGKPSGTTLTDSDGTSSLYYKVVGYNSTSTAQEDDSTVDWFQIATTYISEDEVRREAGFDLNDDISDDRIRTQVDMAESAVNSAIGSVYQLPLTETPNAIKNATKLLAAGYLLLQQYGAEAEGTSRDGQAKVDQANNFLDKISTGDLLLFGAAGAELARLATGDITINNEYDDGDDGRGGGWPLDSDTWTTVENNPDNL